MRILVVEDEVRLAKAICEILKDNKYNAEAVYDGEDGLDYALSGLYDAVILDVMLPKMDGFSVVSALRAKKSAVPVLLLTARDEISDKVAGLDCGADDYMTKPFSPDELLARVRALTRRQGEVVLGRLEYADISLSLESYELSCGSKSIRLGFKEFEVMSMLLKRPDAVVPKEDLIVRIWGAESGAGDNNVEAYISFLRKKLFAIGSKITIGTVRKVGYKLEAEEC